MSLPAVKTRPAPDAGVILSRATVRAARFLAVAQADLAQVIGVSGATLSRIAHGRKALEPGSKPWQLAARSEEHTSELQSQSNLVCRLLLEKKEMGVEALETGLGNVFDGSAAAPPKTYTPGLLAAVAQSTCFKPAHCHILPRTSPPSSAWLA